MSIGNAGVIVVRAGAAGHKRYNVVGVEGASWCHLFVEGLETLLPVSWGFPNALLIEIYVCFTSVLSSVDLLRAALCTVSVGVVA